MSRRVLSELCGLSKNSIARYERGERVPSITDAEALADFFVQSAEEDVGQLDGDPLRLARTVRALRPWLAHSVAYGEILAILLGEGTRPRGGGGGN